MKLAETAAWLLSVSGCVAVPDSGPTDLGSTQQSADIFASSIWNTRRLDVCFEQAGFTQEREWVKEAVENSWGTETALAFRGWEDQCSSSALDKNIRISFITSGDSNVEYIDIFGFKVARFGSQINHAENGMELNIQPDLSDRKFYLQEDAVHEFGHALGLVHEQRRGDTPSWCTESAGGPDGSVYVGEWDWLSIMNYCNTRPYENWGRPSGIDIWAIQGLYGSAFTVSAVVLPSASQLSVFGRTGTLGTAERPFAGSTALPWNSLGGASPTSPPTAAALYSTLDVFVRTPSGSLSHNTKSASGYSGWHDLGGFVVGQPTVVGDWVTGHTVVMVRNTDNGLSIRERTGSSWGAWQNLPNPGGMGLGPIGRPAAVLGQDGRYYVVATFNDGTLQTTEASSSGGTWSTWSLVAGPTASALAIGSPTLVAMKYSGSPIPVHLYAFARGTNGELLFWKRPSDNPLNPGWQVAQAAPWSVLPTSGVRGTIAAVSRTYGLIEMFYRDESGNLWMTSVTSSGTWSSNKLTGSSSITGLSVAVVGSPEVISTSTSSLDVFFYTDAREEMLLAWNGSSWTWRGLGHQSSPKGAVY